MVMSKNKNKPIVYDVFRSKNRIKATCWWLGKALMASNKSCVTVLNSRTGIPAARSCFVRLNTHALAASWTLRVAG